MNVLSLFAGIGGLELGLERAGMTTVGQVEIDPFCRRVLAKHWPEVPRHDDVRTAVDWWQRTPCDYCPRSQGWYLETFTSDYAVICRRCRRTGYILRPDVDVICGGFPCQDISNAGRREGIAGARSGLWAHMRDTVRALRPRYVVMENVAALLARGLDVVAADLAEIGYDLEWDCIPASAVGAPHQRDRWWGIAYPQCRGPHRQGQRPETLADAEGVTLRSGLCQGGPGWLRWGRPGDRRGTGNPWATEPGVGRVADGVPARVDRLRALGNAVVPQVAEHIGRLIVEAEARAAA